MSTFDADTIQQAIRDLLAVRSEHESHMGLLRWAGAGNQEILLVDEAARSIFAQEIPTGAATDDIASYAFATGFVLGIQTMKRAADLKEDA